MMCDKCKSLLTIVKKGWLKKHSDLTSRDVNQINISTFHRIP